MHRMMTLRIDVSG